MRSATLDKGSLEGFWNTKSTDKSALLKDLNESNGQVLVEVVTKGAGSETHLVTIAGEVLDGSVHLDIPIESLSEVSATQGGDNAEASATTGAEKAGGNPPVPVKVSEPPVKTLVNMATQTDLSGERFRSVSRLEFKYHADFIERICKETQDKVKKIEEWQSDIEKRVAAVEYNDCTLSTQGDAGAVTPAISAKGKPVASQPLATAIQVRDNISTLNNRPQASGTARPITKGSDDIRVLRSAVKSAGEQYVN